MARGLHARGTADAGAAINAALDPIIDELFRNNRDGEHLTRAAYAFDALDELCEITGVGPVPVPVARGLLGEAVLKLVITKGVDVANVTSLGRGPTAAMKVALAWTSPTCVVEGCSRTHIEYDHRLEWRETHHTRLDETDPVCDGHHDKKTNHGWALIEGTGKRPMVPPDDPRHPHHTQASDPPSVGAQRSAIAERVVAAFSRPRARVPCGPSRG